MTDWGQVRAEFPSLAGWTYLNTATFGQHPLAAERAIEEHLRRRTREACHDFLDWFDDHDRLRGKIARLVNCGAADVAFFQNACSALGLLMNGLDWEAGDEILTLEGEFPNQIYAPAQRGLVLREVPAERLIGSIGSRTKLVAVSTVNYITGFRVALEPLARACHERGVLLYVDGTQSVGALRFDFGALQPAMLAVNAYKWMCCPSGAAFAAVHPELRARMRPLTVGWRSHHGWRNVENLHHGAPELKESAEKYEGGMLASPLLYALEACTDLFLELTPEAIEQRVLALARSARRVFADLGHSPLPHGDSAIVAVPMENAPAVARELKQKRILVSARHGLLRVSLHLYNADEDIGRLAAALPECGSPTPAGR